MTLFLSKTGYCNAVQCEKMLWLSRYRPELFDSSGFNASVLQSGNEVGDLARGLFGEYTEVPYGSPAEMIRFTEECFERHVKIIAEASFAWQGLFCSVDILINDSENKVQLYEVKSAVGVHPVYMHDIAFQTYILKKLGYDVEKVCLIHLNHGYQRKGDLDLKQLFTICDLTDATMKSLSAVEKKIGFLKKYMEQTEEPLKEISEGCFSPYACGFQKYCFRNLPVPNVFDLAAVQLKTKISYYRRGLVSFEDLHQASVLGQKQAMQVEYTLYDRLDHIEKDRIRLFLSELKYPLYFLDFETFQPAIPPYDNTYPYMQIPFQYSLHVQEEKNGKLYHKEFLAETGSDPRRALAERLCADIPENVCVLAWNMAFEKGRIAHLAELYEDLSDHLQSICVNMKDLIIPFQQRWYYSGRMHGSSSIKAVLPALFPDEAQMDYQNLAGVHNGLEASAAFLLMPNMEESRLAEYRRSLLKYCELDTFAMVKILEVLFQAAD